MSCLLYQFSFCIILYLEVAHSKKAVQRSKHFSFDFYLTWHDNGLFLIRTTISYMYVINYMELHSNIELCLGRHVVFIEYNNDT